MSVASLSVTPIRITRRVHQRNVNQTITETEVFSGRARVQPLSGSENVKYGRDVEVVMAKAYIAGTVDVQHGDILTADGKDYIIRAIRNIDLLGRFTTLEMERQR